MLRIFVRAPVQPIVQKWKQQGRKPFIKVASMTLDDLQRLTAQGRKYVDGILVED